MGRGTLQPRSITCWSAAIFLHSTGSGQARSGTICRGLDTLYAIDKDGKLSKIKIGRCGTPQAVVKANTWFAAALDSTKSYSLLGCTMSPDLDYRDWELAKRGELVMIYLQHRKVIERYTK